MKMMTKANGPQIGQSVPCSSGENDSLTGGPLATAASPIVRIIIDAGNSGV